MIKHNYFVKFINKIDLIINKLLKKNLNKLNKISLSKITKSNKFLLTLVTLVVIFLSYLSIPSTYNKTEISKELNNQLQKKLNFNFNLSENFEYNFFPRPHFIYNNSYILDKQKKISKIEELKIFISLKNLFSLKKFDVQNLIIEKSNFNLDNQTSDFFIKLLDANFKSGELVIKDSNIFYKNKDDEILFINKILKMEYFYDNKDLRNKALSKNEIFNLPYLIELSKNNIEKKFYSKLDLNFLNLSFHNQLDFGGKVKKGSINFTLNNDKINIIYEINKSNLIFNAFDKLENSKLNYEGKVDFKPFYFNLGGIIKEINILYLLNSNSLILQLLKTEVLNNKNLNVDLDIYGDKFKNLSDFFKINLNSKIQEGLIDLDNSRFSWKENVVFVLEDSLVYVKNGELILDGKLTINIKNYDQVYKFLLTPKIHRGKLSNIKANLIYNFDQKILNLNNILIDNKRNKDVNKTLENLIFKKNKLQNKVYLKNILNRALKIYAG